MLDEQCAHPELLSFGYKHIPVGGSQQAALRGLRALPSGGLGHYSALIVRLRTEMVPAVHPREAHEEQRPPRPPRGAPVPRIDFRVSYSDLIGVDRGRDVLLERSSSPRSTTASRSAARRTTPRRWATSSPCREVSSPGLSPIIDGRTRTSTTLQRHCRGSRAPCGAWPTPSSAGRPGGSPRVVAPPGSREKLSRARPRPIVGPELEFYLLEQDVSRHRAGSGTARRTGNVYIVRPQGRPREHSDQSLRQLCGVRARRGCGEPRVLLRSVRDQPLALRGARRRRPRLPFQDRGPGAARIRASWPPSWPSRSTTRAARASTSTSPPGPTTGKPSSTTRTGGRTVGHRSVRGRRRTRARTGTGRVAEPHDQLLQAVRPGHPGSVADRLGAGQPQRDDPDPTGAGTCLADGASTRRRLCQPLSGRRRVPRRCLSRHQGQAGSSREARGLRLRHRQGRDASG